MIFGKDKSIPLVSEVSFQNALLEKAARENN
jgi:hypothetical protein